MGACLVVRSHADCDSHTLTDWIQSIQDDDAYRNGNEYSGGWNMCRGTPHINPNKVFSSRNEAEEYIADNHQKWSALLAVKYMNKSVAAEPASMVQLRSALNQARTQWSEYPAQIHAKIVSGKSKFRACPACQSKIALNRLSRPNSISCPVCGSSEFMLTDTYKKTLEKLRVKIVDLEEKLKIAEKKQLDKAKNKSTSWLVGGWCAE